MVSIYSGISFNLADNLVSTAVPLFENEQVEAIEWSFDSLYKFNTIPEWFSELLQAFGKEKRLIGHGIYFSLFAGKWSQEQQHWLDHLNEISANYQFDHISEHFGFMTGKNFHQGAPLSIPYTSSTLALGQDRLKRIYEACHCPVGLENLAFSFSLADVKQQGEFLDRLVEPVNGFIILDLHNIYCQLNNFDISFDEIIKFYPLHRVRELHLSGGSWENSKISPERKIRRDTHDGGVPDEVFELLQKAVPLMPQLKFVVLEQLSMALGTEEEKQRFRLDFEKMNKILKSERYPKLSGHRNAFLPTGSFPAVPRVEDLLLHEQQVALSTILETAETYDTAKRLIESSVLSGTAWQTGKWEPHMLETAIAIAQKWKYGFGD